MTRHEIVQRLRLPILTLCLAAVSGKVGNIKEATKALLDEVERMLKMEC